MCFQGAKYPIFQSPFSGDFLCFLGLCKQFGKVVRAAFNLHFQEIFFVSTYRVKLDIETIRELFQSPFSGDFLCFEFCFGDEALSSFQSPFSGDFLCFLHVAG